MPNLGRVWILGPVIVVLITTSIVTLNYQLSRAQKSDCPPVDLSLLDVNFRVRTPSLSTFPQGYSLQAAQPEADAAKLYYSDHSLCPFPRSIDDQLPDKTVLISIVQRLDIENGEQFIREQITIQRETIPNIDYVEINGMPGYGWNSFISNVSSENSDVGARRYPSALQFYNQEDRTIYTLTGMEDLTVLLEIAKSIS